jgi:hypothetical protein
MGVPTLEAVDDGEAAAEQAYDGLLRTLSDGATLDLFVERGTNVSPYLATYTAQSSTGDDSIAHAISSRRQFLAEDPKHPSVLQEPAQQDLAGLRSGFDPRGGGGRIETIHRCRTRRFRRALSSANPANRADGR